MEPIGMPGARPFNLETAENEPIFVVRANSFERNFGYREAREIGVMPTDCYGGSFEGRKVFGFTHAEMKEVLKRSGMIMSERYGSTRDRVEWAVLVPKPRFSSDIAASLVDEAMLAHQFEVKQFNGEGQDKFAYLVSRILGPTVNRKIIFSVPHGVRQPYSNLGGFQVYVWSTPDETCHRDHDGWTPSCIWGYNVDHIHGPFRPDPMRPDAGMLIKDGDYAVAELFENALYIHHDLVHESTADALHIMARVLQEAANYVRNPEKLKDEICKAREAYLQKQQAEFEALVQKAIPSRAENRKGNMDAARREVARLRQQCFEAERKLFGLEHAMLDPAVVAERFRSEFAKLQQGKVAFVEKVEFRVDGDDVPQMHVYTSELTAKDTRSGKTYVLGHYRIELNLDAKKDEYDEYYDSTIKMFNLDRQPEDYHHPHVDTDGTPCLGNLGQQLPEYVAHFEIEAAITLAIAFLQTLNPDDGGWVYIQNFPLVDQDNKETL